jgi:Flp pilus assembly protein TadG
VAALEFAMVTPILLLMIFVMLGMGIYLMFVHEVQELASSAARSSVAGLNEAERNTLAAQFVANSVANSALLNAADLSVQTATSGTPATNYSVTISYTLKDTPIPLLASLISVPLKDISRTSTIEFGGY